MRSLRLTILGSGTSSGVPVIGCHCDVCRSKDPRNQRSRAAIMLTLPKSAVGETNEHIVIDTGPEFRLQMLSAGVECLRHVIYTHTHADHMHGFDDLRAFWFHQKAPVVCYISNEHVDELKTRFAYAFAPTSYLGIKPQVELKVFQADEPFYIEGLRFDPVLLPHGDATSAAFRLGKFAYATDFKDIPLNIRDRWRGQIDLMVASGVHWGPHRTHSTIPETLALFADLQVKQGIITHLAHDIDYMRDAARLPPHVRFAHDGMTLDVMV